VKFKCAVVDGQRRFQTVNLDESLKLETVQVSGHLDRQCGSTRPNGQLCCPCQSDLHVHVRIAAASVCVPRLVLLVLPPSDRRLPLRLVNAASPLGNGIIV